MNIIKIALLWTNWDFERTLIFNLIKNLCKKKIIIVKPKHADLLILGSYYANDKTYPIYKFLRYFVKDKKNFSFIDIYQKKLFDSFLMSRLYKPLTLFYNTEIMDYDSISADYYISGHLGVQNKKHFSLNPLKEDIDWSECGIPRYRGGTMVERYGNFLNQDKLILPQGNDFLKKKREMFFAINNLTRPRTFMYEAFSKQFKFCTMGNAFGGYKKFKVSKLLKKYAFSFCPDHYTIPYYTNSRSAYAFISKSLPITYINQAANNHLNKKAFINLNDHFSDNFSKIMENLKSDEFLKKFTNQPFLLKKLNLVKEIDFVKKILSYL